MEDSTPKTVLTEEKKASGLALGLLAATWCALRPWAARAVFLIIAATLVLAFGMKYHAEDNLLTIYLAYLPSWAMALPLACGVMVAFVFACWRAMLSSIVALFFVIGWLGGHSLRWSPPLPLEHSSKTFSVITYNRGQGSEKVLTAFAEQMKPDVAVFQDAGRRLPKLTGLSPFVSHPFNSVHGEFVLLSRWPVLESQPLLLDWMGSSTGSYLAGSRSVINWDGRPVIIYNIHFPTPRDLLSWYSKRGTFLYGLLGLVPHTSLNLRHQEYLTIWRARVALTRQVVGRVGAEKTPVILMGDMNFPALGRSYQMFRLHLQDCHAEVGVGFGHTFPGNMKSILRHFSPWMRLDHLFVSRHWQVVSSYVSNDGFSQHLPTGAVLQMP